MVTTARGREQPQILQRDETAPEFGHVTRGENPTLMCKEVRSGQISHGGGLRTSHRKVCGLG
jgi:hypothetical protein